MLPSRPKLDPQGYYARLGVEPVAPQASIVSAFRAKARLLHPDVRRTGDAAAFVAVKQAYDVLSNRERREAYDRMAREAAEETVVPEVIVKPAFYDRSAKMAQAAATFGASGHSLGWTGRCLFLGVYEIDEAPRGTLAGGECRDQTERGNGGAALGQRTSGRSLWPGSGAAGRKSELLRRASGKSGHVVAS